MACRSRTRRPRRVRAALLVVAGLAFGLAGCSGHIWKPPLIAAKPSVRPVVAFLGDSYTVGYGATNLADKWTSAVSRDLGWTEVNAGILGTGYATAANPYLYRVPAVVAAKPAIVVISGGYNDWAQGVSVAQFTAAAEATLTALRNALAHAKLIVLNPLFPDADLPTGLAEFGTVLRSAITAADATYLDIGQPLRGHPADMFSDQVHPNNAGYGLIAQAFVSAYRRLPS